MSSVTKVKGQPHGTANLQYITLSLGVSSFPSGMGRKNPSHFEPEIRISVPKLVILRNSWAKSKFITFCITDLPGALKFICTNYIHHNYIKRGVADSSTQTILVTQKSYSFISLFPTNCLFPRGADGQTLHTPQIHRKLVHSVFHHVSGQKPSIFC